MGIKIPDLLQGIISIAIPCRYTLLDCCSHFSGMLETVTEAIDSYDLTTVFGGYMEFASNTADVGVHGTCVNVSLTPPYLIEQVDSGQQSVRILEQVSILVACQSFGPVHLSTFTSDCCRKFTDGTVLNKDLWHQCCTEHDKKYWAVGSYDERLMCLNRFENFVIVGKTNYSLSVSPAEVRVRY